MSTAHSDRDEVSGIRRVLRTRVHARASSVRAQALFGFAASAIVAALWVLAMLARTPPSRGEVLCLLGTTAALALYGDLVRRAARKQLTTAVVVELLDAMPPREGEGAQQP